MEKIGLVLEGGGVRGAYTAGALAWLTDNDIHFDYSVGISSGAVYLSCYLMGDKKIAHNMSTKYAGSDECVGIKALLTEGHYVAYKKVFDVFLKEKEGMTIQPLKDANPDMEVGAYDMNVGKTLWFGPQDMDDDLVLLRGTCALPIASAIVHWNGRSMLDGGITKMIPIERAIEQGCTRCMVITTKPADYVRKPSSWLVVLMMKWFYRKYPKQIVEDYKVRHLNYNYQIDMVRRMEKEGTVLHMLPSETIKVSRWKGDNASCEKLYELGYNDMENRRDEIFAFMKKGE